jgi:hypothetical protein
LSEDYGNLSEDHSGWKTIDLKTMLHFEVFEAISSLLLETVLCLSFEWRRGGKKTLELLCR